MDGATSGTHTGNEEMKGAFKSTFNSYAAWSPTKKILFDFRHCHTSKPSFLLSGGDFSDFNENREFYLEENSNSILLMF